MKQQELQFRMPDKNGQFRGGKRKGAGRPRAGRKPVSHAKRKEFDPRHPLHVTLRVVAEVGGLRKHDSYKAIGWAVQRVMGREDFRIVHVSIQADHVHLLVEASGKVALAKGMQAFQISAAKHLNDAVGKRTGERRKGRVFGDRYHREVIDNTRQARNALAYVLNNWRKHREDKVGLARTWRLDPYSSAVTFPGWKERADSPYLWMWRRDYDLLATRVAKTWILAEGWKQFGLISAFEVPGSS